MHKIDAMGFPIHGAGFFDIATDEKARPAIV
jgi:hypothetical protein